MPRKKKVIEPKIEEVIEEVKEEIVETPKTSFDVLNSQGDFVRTYSVEIHGEKAGELAREFAGKINGTIK